MEVKSFPTLQLARKYMEHQIYTRIQPINEQIGRLHFKAFSYALDQDRFTNIYDISYPAQDSIGSIKLFESTTYLYDAIKQNLGLYAATPCGYFFLADTCTKYPRQLTLNLAIQNGQIKSLPVVDREALLCDKKGCFSVDYIAAKGKLCLNGHVLRWAGCRTHHLADCIVYGSGNCRITYQTDQRVGKIRTLDQASTLTPAITTEQLIDIGCVNKPNGDFVGVAIAPKGCMDIFDYDVVVRCPKKYIQAHQPICLNILSIGHLTNYPESAASVGPMLKHQDFTKHPINFDLSLGEDPPMLNTRISRQVIYESNQRIHIRVFDGSPANKFFSGVTPNEVLATIEAEGPIAWGCFLDSGKTAKVCLRHSTTVNTYGNKDYLLWPDSAHSTFRWQPNHGRAVGSAIMLRT